MSTNQVDLSISIVNTNNRDIVRDCLDSIRANTHCIRYEVLVVDNASTDGSVEMIRSDFPEVKLIINDIKQGFSTNHNKALGLACGRYLMILNDDTIILDQALDKLVAFMDEHPEAGGVGPKFLNADRTNQPAFAKFPTPFYEAIWKPLMLQLRPQLWDVEDVCEVDAVGGACLMIRQEIEGTAGLLDESFAVLYSEEIDWCYRIRRQGWKLYHYPAARIVHLGGQTTKRTSSRMRLQLHKNNLLYFRKHKGFSAAYAYRVLLLSRTLAKLALIILRYPLLPDRQAAKAALRDRIQLVRFCLNGRSQL